MDDPFLYGLLFILLLIFLIFKSAFSAINPLLLELDKKKQNYHFRILSFISKKIIGFSIAINICYFIVLTILIILLKNDFLVISKTFSPLLYTLFFIISVGLIILPAIIAIPKTIGEYFSNDIINISAIPLMVIYVIFFPFTKLVLLLSNAPFRIIYNQEINLDQELHFDKDDLNKLVTESQKHVAANEEVDAEIKLFKNALEFSEIKIRECMIPRTEITAVELNDVEKEIKDKFISSGYSKILIYRDSIENIIGYIKSKSLFFNTELKKNIKHIKYFPESMPANKLLRYFIRTGQNIAVVVDEFGGTSGIITIEDILEEIFGEIQDEHDTENLYEKRLSENDFILSGRFEIDYLNEKYNLNIPESDEYETIAGFILYHTESLPRINDKITIDNFNFNILKVSDTRVDLVKLEISSQQA